MSTVYVCTGQSNALVVAAINVYRHSDDMIERLEKAGLGFYVRATETQQRLGIIFYTCVVR